MNRYIAFDLGAGSMDVSDLLRAWIYEDLDRALAGGTGLARTDELYWSVQEQLYDLNKSVSGLTEMMQERGSRQTRNIANRRDAFPKAAAKKKTAAKKKDTAKKSARRK